jgi:heptosyltransferase-2
MQKRVLIIKLGYCETLVNEKGFTPSLGDVFRHTVLLHHYRDAHVTWLTTKSALPLLEGNPLIQELMVYGENTESELLEREFDEALCLEKAPAICRIAKNVTARRYLGFGWNGKTSHAFPGAESALDIANGRDQFLPIQALLFQMVDDYWRGEDYVLGYQPRSAVTADVGFNHLVGTKWPTKAWPKYRWQELEAILTNHGMKVDWQKGEGDLQTYMDWINSCRMIVTCDSLGMHLGLALKRKVVALFGPTPTEGIYMYGRGIILSADWACERIPCMQSECSEGCACMTELQPKIVARSIINILNGRH